MSTSIEEHKEIINLLGGGKKLTARLKALSNEKLMKKLFIHGLGRVFQISGKLLFQGVC